MDICSKKPTKIEIKHRLSMKSKSLAYFPPFQAGTYAQVLKVEDLEGKVWHFRLIIRKGKYKKPVVSSGWRRFVTTKKLEFGDEVQFHKYHDEATHEVKYMIKVKKPVKLFKVVIGYHYV